MARSQQVTSDEYPYLPVRFGTRNQVVEEAALLDTGFTGSLAIPATWRNRLGRPDGWGRWRLADGSIIHAPVYLGSVEIIGLPEVRAATIVVVGDEYILGRRILDRYEITLDHGQRVIVSP
jgi:predicted aspartyl protease